MKKEDLNIVFMGTPEISAYVFEAMIQDGYKFIGLIAQPDKPVGRHGELEKVPTKLIAEKYGIPVYQPIKIRKDYTFLEELKPDIIITLAYGQIVPQGVLDVPKYGCLNLHGSLLPKYRGAAPIQYAIINREKVTGMTLMEMTAQMDAGRMYAKKEVNIAEDDNTTKLFEKMAVAAKELILESLPKYIDGELEGIPQNEEEVTFCPTIKPEQEKINLDLSKSEILGWIKGLSDFPGGYVYIDNLKLKLFDAKIIDSDYPGENGQIVQANKLGLIIKVKDGYISLLELQKEGKKRMDYKSFINGNQNLIGKILK